ncbi:MAG: N4-gp56 family major capsid protein [Ectothiorhodospiraceae bacterium]|nr:N4-gp56 family major capsid protein [Ectothiorhodospiraceae bacterium]
MSQTTYGDISPRTAAYAQKELLKRGIPYLCLEKFGQGRPVPQRNSKQTIFRRYEALDPTPNALVEGVTPSAKKLEKTDIPATLVQYGDRIQLTDVIMDTHEDNVLQESIEVLGEQAAEMIETMRFGIVKAGTNVFFSNGSTRSAVNTPLTKSLQRRVTRALKRQRARKVTSVIRSTPSYATEAVAPSFIGLAHTDLESDIREMDGFVPTEKYGSMTPYENEIGKVEDVRYILSTIYLPWEGAGATGGTNVLETDDDADVYPVLYIARDSYGIVPLKGKTSLTPMVVNPKPSDSDPLAQRGHVGWKSMQTAVILNDMWMARAEVAVTD